MRRVIATMLNGIVCIFITVIFYILAAMLRRFTLTQSRLTELYSPQSAIPLSLALLGFPLLAGIVYFLFINKVSNGVTLGEKLMEIRVITEYKLRYVLLDYLLTVFWVITLMCMWRTGSMPYDRYLAVQVQNVGNTAGKFRKRYVAAMLLVSMMFSGNIQYWLSDDSENSYLYPYYAIGPASFLIDAYMISGAYAVCIELDSTCIKEKRLSEAELGERELDIFSESGKKQAWGFTSVTKAHYENEYKTLGVDAAEICEGRNIAIVSFGRKLKTVRIIDEPWLWIDAMREPFPEFPHIYLHLVLDDVYEENMVYFYNVYEYDITRFMEIPMTNDKGDVSVVWVNTDYGLYQDFPESRHLSAVGREGILGRWEWAYEWLHGNA
jgi:hypothetical protein